MRKLILTCLILSACGKAPATDDFSDLSGLDEKSDSFSYRMKLVGSLTYGTSATTKYTQTPRYRAFKFTAQADDAISAWVRSTQGDAVAWLLDASYNVVTFNDDADATTSDAHLVAHLGTAGTYYIVLRDYNLATHYFTVSLDSGCTAHYTGGGTADENVAGMESLLSFTPSFQLVHGSVPACLDLTSSAVRTQVAAAVLANNNVYWASNAQPVGQAVKSGAADFLATLVNARQALDNLAAMAPLSNATFQSLYPHANDLQSGLVGDSKSNPKAFFEFDLHIEAAECSQDAHVRVDTRAGQIVILRALGC
jgi:hypothetical protein